MDCIYYPNLEASPNPLLISGNEAKHLKALHIRSGERIMLTNGKGMMASMEIDSVERSNFTLLPMEFIKDYGELPFRLGLAIGILDNRERFEFALEKSIELGISDFFPLITKYTQKKIIKNDRLISKSIAAIEQCKRSRLPVIHKPINIFDSIHILNQFSYNIVCDISGILPNSEAVNSSTMILIASEGGFTDEELNYLHGHCNVWKLGSRRLRAETAAITALSLVNFSYECNNSLK